MPQRLPLLLQKELILTEGLLLDFLEIKTTNLLVPTAVWQQGMRAQSILSSVIFVFGIFWAGVGDGDFL